MHPFSCTAHLACLNVHMARSDLALISQFPAIRCRESLRAFYILLLPIVFRKPATLILYSLSLEPNLAHCLFGTLFKYRNTPLHILRRRLVVLITHSLSQTPTPTDTRFILHF